MERKTIDYTKTSLPKNARIIEIRNFDDLDWVEFPKDGSANEHRNFVERLRKDLDYAALKKRLKKEPAYFAADYIQTEAYLFFESELIPVFAYHSKIRHEAYAKFSEGKDKPPSLDENADFFIIRECEKLPRVVSYEQLLSAYLVGLKIWSAAKPEELP